MRIAEGLPLPGAHDDSSVVTIGVFDGLHRGHLQLPNRVLDVARARDASPVVLTFREHPDVLLRGAAPPPLMTLDERLEGLEQLGFDAVWVLDFDEKMKSMRVETFTDDILRAGLNCEMLVLGHDSAICKNREGTAERFNELGIEAERIERFSLGQVPVSASTIREALAGGNIAAVNEMLGRRYSLRGEVVHGDGRGRGLGFPTANLEVPDLCLPTHGVYAVEVLVSDSRTRIKGVTNLGVRPTFGDGGATIETHLLEDHDGNTFQGDLYGKKLRLEFAAYLRAEMTFASADELKRQIAEDVAAARAALQASA